MSNSIMRKIAKFIVEKHIIIMLLFVVLVIYSALSISKVRVNEDITALLPPKTATRRGLTVMENEFTAFASANVMVSNITYEKAAELAENLREIENVATVSFDDSSEHYASSSALFTVAFSAESEDERAIDALEQIKDSLSDYEVSVSTTVGQDYVKQIAGEITQVLILALIVIAAVLLFTSKSYFEVIILFIVFAVAAVLNMGTNYWLREISSVTNSIAIILQLALAIDYAIIFCHRFQDEYDRQRNVKSALTDSLAYSIIEISSSSLTTISGLVALMLMQFRLGYDLGLVLTKGIICSMLTVFLLMPGLIMLFHKALLKTRHKNLVPNITGWGRLLSKKVPVFLISLKAGGTGLNLTGADIVIHYDPWWNAAAQNQATDRAHRIGQKHTVTVYKLIARHTIEEKILKLQENKKALSDQILSEEGVTASHLTKEDLLQILQN